MPSSRVPFLLAILILTVFGFAQGEPPVRTDPFGDPLPNNAVCRLGSSRFRLDAYTTPPVLTPDGKRVAISTRNSRLQTIRFLDTTTGKEVQQVNYGGPNGTLGLDIMAFSPDGQSLAAASRHGGRGVQIFNVNSGNLVRTLTNANQEITHLNFSADGKVLIAGGGYSTRNGGTAWDTTSGKELGRFSIPADDMLGLTVSPDGKLVAGWSRKTGVVLWETVGGKELHKISLADTTGRYPIQAVISPDGKHLALAEIAAISVWDTASSKPLYRSAARASISLLAYSPDGKTLAAADSGAVQLWEAATGKRLGLHAGLPGQPTALVFAEDKLLALGSVGQALWLRDVKAGKLLSPSGGHQFPVRSIVFAPDGKSLFTTASDGVLVWDAQTGRELRRVEVKETELDRRMGSAGRNRTYQLSPDGKRLLASSDINMGLSVIDTASGEVEFVVAGQGFEYRRNQAAVISADGNLLATLPEPYRRMGTVQLWDLSSGQPLSPLKTKNEEPQALALTPDGKTVAVVSNTQRGGAGTSGLVQIWDVATGQERLAFPLPDRAIGGMAFAPDGVLLATAGHMRNNTAEVILWNAATGREYLKLPCPPGVGSNLAFAPDGRTLALVAGTNQPDGMKLKIFEMASGTVRHDLPISGYMPGVPFVVAYSPDSRTLAIGMGDTTVMLWDVGGRLTAPSPLMDAELDTLWASLDEADAAHAHATMNRMTAAPKETVAFLTAKLRPAEGPAADEKSINRLISDLDSEDFATRVKASKELAGLGAAAKPALEKVLQSKPSPEQHRRIEELLDKLIEVGPKRDRLRPTRAMEVLERVATREARELLKALSEGQTAAPLTREAKATLDRLTAR